MWFDAKEKIVKNRLLIYGKIYGNLVIYL